METQTCVSAADPDEMDRKAKQDAAWLDNVWSKAKDLRWGQIVVIIQDGKPCRVDKMESELLR